jgi:hypothetical protein
MKIKFNEILVIHILEKKIFFIYDSSLYMNYIHCKYMKECQVMTELGCIICIIFVKRIYIYGDR